MLTMRDLNRANTLVNLKGSTAGVKLLGEGEITSSVHIEVSRASASAIKAVEDAGGTVTCAHYNRLALRALLKPHKFEQMPRRARPPPRLMRSRADEKRGQTRPSCSCGTGASACGGGGRGTRRGPRTQKIFGEIAPKR